VQIQALARLVWLIVLFSSAIKSEEILDLSLEELLQVRVSTASHATDTLEAAAADVIVISEEDIHNRGYRNLQDLLADIAAIDLHTKSEATTFNRVAARGIAGNGKLQILLDGHRINSPTGEDIPIAHNFPLYFVKQVEIVFGPASAIYGADAFSLVINLISKKAKEEGELEVATGSDGLYSAHLYDAGSLGDQINYQVGLNRFSVEGGRLTTEYPQQFQLNDLLDFSGQTVVAASDRSSPSFPEQARHFYASLSKEGSWRIVFNRSIINHPTSTGTRPDTVDYGRNPVWTTELSTLFFTKYWRLSDRWSSTSQLSYNRYQLDQDSKFSNIFVGFKDGYKFAQGEGKRIEQQWHFSGFAEQDLVFGLSYEDLSSIPKSADLPSPYNPELGHSQQNLNYLFVGDLPIKIFKIDWRNTSAYVEWKYQLLKNLRFTSGVRYENSSNYGATTNPRLGIHFKPGLNHEIKMIVGEAFLAPTPRFTHDHFGSFAFMRNDGLAHSFFMQVPNENIEPETLKTFEINYLYRYSRDWHIRIVGYRSEVDNLIDRKITEQPISNFIPGGFIETTQVFANTGNLNIYGLEFRSRYLTYFADSKFSIDFEVAYQHGDFRVANQILQLPYIAEQKANLQLNWQNRRWSHFLSVRARGETPNNVGAITPGFR